MRKISNVEVFLDDNVPEYMDGLIRIARVDVQFDNGDVESLDFVDNTEFHTEDQLIQYVVKKLDIPRDLIEVIE